MGEVSDPRIGTGSSARRRAGWLVVAMLAVTLSGCGKDISGQYLAKLTDGVGWLQLVRTDDNHLTGQFDMVSLGSDGTITTTSMAVTGAMNGSEISLAMKSSSPLSVGTMIAGTRDGDNLTLTGGFRGSVPATSAFIRSSLVEYQKASTDLNDRGQKIRSERAAATAAVEADKAKAVMREHERGVITKLNDLGAKMAQTTQAYDAILTKLGSVPARYGAISTKMSQMLDQERSIAGNSNAFVARTKIVVDMGQGPIATDQLHFQVEGVDRDARSRMDALEKDAVQGIEACHRQWKVRADDPVAPGGDAWNEACKPILASEEAYRSGYRNIQAKLGELEQVYRTEKGKQGLYLKTAQGLQ